MGGSTHENSRAVSRNQNRHRLRPSASMSTSLQSITNLQRSGPLPLKVSQGSFWERRLRADALTTTNLMPKTIMTESDVRNGQK